MMTRISFDIKEFQDFLDRQGCDYCMQGWMHLVGDVVMFDWTSNIQHVITNHKDVELVGELIE